jgi:hypothetical protein
LRRFRSLGSSDFFVFFESFCGILCATRFVDSNVRFCLWGSWIDVLFIFMLDLDPSNARFDLQLENFGWKPSFVLELGSLSIPGDLVGLRPQVFGPSIP